jgi:putative transposase
MMEERGVSVDHSTINRGAVRLLPLIEKKAREHKCPLGDSWHMDETSIKVKGVWKYFYRAVYNQGKTVAFLLTAKRDMAAAKRLFDKALERMAIQTVSRWTRAASTRRRSMRSTPAAPR